ncbi:MAG: glutamate racemase [Candidatus Omnitrophica bacterium]|nr:glutamate racemase [Candidatus Omnitrophota bacterium]MBU4457978.1 glutamate racemase [Candidatus Omnitrophota bacterium]
MNNRPIGIFDSGVGGLTVVREVMKALPNEKIVYLGDTARVPYGTKSNETIKRFSIENAEFLSRFKVKLIIVACNSASSIALPALKKRFKIPIIGVIKPGAKKAASITRNNRIGVIGTPTTVKSKAYDREIKLISRNRKIVSRACPLFVPLAEEGWLNGKITTDIVKKYLEPLKKNKIDTLVLGCTHYPLLRGVISKVVGKNVRIVDSASSVAGEVRAILERQDRLAKTKRPAHRFFATDAVEQFVKVGERFLGKKIKKAMRANHV